MIKMNYNTNTPNKNILTRPIIPKNVEVPSLIIKINRLFLYHEDSNSQSPNSDNEYRQPRKPSRALISHNKNTFFSTPNSHLKLIEATQNEIFSNTNYTQPDTLNENQKNQITLLQPADNNPKKPPQSVINISQLAQLQRDITETIKNDFAIAAKFNKIKINVQTISDFRSLTKYLGVKKYKYYTYRLKDEKDISKKFKILIKSATRITNKNKAP